MTLQLNTGLHRVPEHQSPSGPRRPTVPAPWEHHLFKGVTLLCLALWTEASAAALPAYQHYKFISCKEATGNPYFLLLSQATAWYTVSEMQNQHPTRAYLSHSLKRFCSQVSQESIWFIMLYWVTKKSTSSDPVSLGHRINNPQSVSKKTAVFFWRLSNWINVFFLLNRFSILEAKHFW